MAKQLRRRIEATSEELVREYLREQGCPRTLAAFDAAVVTKRASERVAGGREEKGELGVSAKMSKRPELADEKPRLKGMVRLVSGHSGAAKEPKRRGSPRSPEGKSSHAPARGEVERLSPGAKADSPVRHSPRSGWGMEGSGDGDGGGSSPVDGSARAGWGTSTAPARSGWGSGSGDVRVEEDDVAEEAVPEVSAGFSGSSTWGGPSSTARQGWGAPAKPSGAWGAPASSSHAAPVEDVAVVEDLEGDLADLETVEFSAPPSGITVSSPQKDEAVGLRSPPRVEVPPHLGRPKRVEPDIAMALRKVLFASGLKYFNEAWLKQGWFFTNIKGLRYGLVQQMGGPCGPIACVQAAVLGHLLFGDLSRKSDGANTWDNPSDERRNEALTLAIADIVWRARPYPDAPAVFALRGPSKVMSRSATYKPDGLTERLLSYELRSKADLVEFLESQMAMLTNPDGYGVALFVYSVLLTRGVGEESGGVEDDMDQGFGEDPKLIGAHNYATQEMVNLMIVGAAHSQVFNGTRTLEGGGGAGAETDKTVLRGIPRTGKVGFLTLFEHFGYVEVGSYYKQPEVPVWVVCSESHYSVLFSRDTVLISGEEVTEPFDIFHYDMLAHQDEVYRLTVTPKPEPPLDEKEAKSDHNPPMDLVIRTAWSGAAVDWNGSEPLL